MGTFEFFASRGDVEALSLLADYVIARHYPAASEAEKPYRVLLDGVAARQAELIARWQLIGFHPWCDEYRQHVDRRRNHRLSARVLSLIPITPRQSIALSTRPAVTPIATSRDRALEPQMPRASRYFRCSGRTMARQLPKRRKRSTLSRSVRGALLPGLREQAWLDKRTGMAIRRLHRTSFARMEENKADFTLTFRGLCDLPAAGPEADDTIRRLFNDPTAFDDWATEWRRRLG